MKQDKTLSNYRIINHLDLINDIIQERVKLVALISADEATYFTPDGNPEARRKAESGRYVIGDTAPIISWLEQVYRLKFDKRKKDLSPAHPDFSPYPVKLKMWLISPDGERGRLGRCSALSPEGPLDPIQIPLSRILIEENPANNQISGCGINTPEHQVMVAVHNEFWVDGKGAPQEDIREWIRTNFKDLKLGNNRKLGNSNTKIEYIERFCRPKTKRKGRRLKK